MSGALPSSGAAPPRPPVDMGVFEAMLMPRAPQACVATKPLVPWEARTCAVAERGRCRPCPGDRVMPLQGPGKAKESPRTQRIRTTTNAVDAFGKDAAELDRYASEVCSHRGLHFRS